MQNRAAIQHERQGSYPTCKTEQLTDMQSEQLSNMQNRADVRLDHCLTWVLWSVLTDAGDACMGVPEKAIVGTSRGINPPELILRRRTS
jgi:hypothetical protein